MTTTAEPQRLHHPGLRPVLELALIAAALAGFLLAYGFACYHLGAAMQDVSSSLAILAAIGG